MADDDAQEVVGLYEAAPCGLMSTLPNGTILRVNQTFCTWFGFAADEIVQKKRVQDLMTMGCRIFHQTHWLPLLQMQGSVAEVQLDLVHRAGHTVPIIVNARLREHSEGQRHELALFMAVDRRKYERALLLARREAEDLLESVRTAQEALSLAEARLRLALDSAQLVVWDVDVASGDVRYEAGVQALLGLPAGTEVTANIYSRHMHPDDRESEQQALAAALAPNGSGTYRAEYRLLGHDGMERVVMSSGRAFVDANGRVARFSGVLQDVTTRRKAEALIREQERQARERAVLTEQLVGIVSHDLRTPLQAVSLGATLLSASDLEPTLARTVRRISGAASRASRLVADLLDFTQARLGTGLHVTRVQIDLHDVTAEVVEELRLAWPGRMIEHRRRGDAAGQADPDRIAQVITNLASNALTYGRPTEPVVIVSGGATCELTLEVHNQGDPIPAALLPQIFEPLRRGEQQVKLGSRSVGLGLYIVREIAAAHGGSVLVRSTAEEGTTFLLRLPMQDP